AVSWAGLIKLFPFLLLVPAAAALIRSGPRSSRNKASLKESRWLLKFIITCVAVSGLLVLASTISGRSWVDFFHKITAQFTSPTIAGNNVSLARGLWSIGIHDSPLPTLFSVVSLAVLATMFVRGKPRDVFTTLPRRSLILVAATGWVVHSWLNYYSIGVFLLLPALASQQRIGTATAIAAMAFSFTLPEFTDPILSTNPIILTLKLAPYILIPAWLVMLEFRSATVSIRARRWALAICAFCVLITLGEAWRQRTIRTLTTTGLESLGRRDYGRALQQYDQLTMISPRNAWAYNRKAVAYVNQRDYPNAKANFERAVQLDPDDAQIRQNFARFLFMTGNIDQAAKEFEDTHRLVPFDTSVLSDLARARLKQGRKRDATALLTRALELNPADSTISGLLSQTQQDQP
ncbi:MAG: tetratricopeptide repeat protein, partial [Candidatus Latescibacterota bacterium]